MKPALHKKGLRPLSQVVEFTVTAEQSKMKPALHKKGLRLYSSLWKPVSLSPLRDETCPTEKGIATWQFQSLCLLLSRHRILMKPALQKKGLRPVSIWATRQGNPVPLMKPALQKKGLRHFWFVFFLPYPLVLVRWNLPYIKRDCD